MILSSLAQNGARFTALLASLRLLAALSQPAPLVPGFSTNYLDRSVDPTVDFYGFATGAWRRQNPVAGDKSRWSGFDELHERILHVVRQLLEEASANSNAPMGSPERMSGT